MDGPAQLLFSFLCLFCTQQPRFGHVPSTPAKAPRTKDTGQLPAEAKPKSRHQPHTAVIWGLQQPKLTHAGLGYPVMSSPIKSSRQAGLAGAPCSWCRAVLLQELSLLPLYALSRQIPARLEGARQIFIITSRALLQSLSPGYHWGYLLSASWIN